MAIQLPTFEDPKEFFAIKDALHNISYDLDFSVFRKYKCLAGCKICYIRKDWIDKDRFEQYIDNDLNKKYIDKLLEIFSYFEVITAIDDVYDIKDKYPEQYKFYENYGHLFHIGAMSDNAIFRYAKLVDEVHFKGIREISMSTNFITSTKSEKLIDALNTLKNKYEILQIILLVFTDPIDLEKVRTVLKWAEANNIAVRKQLEICDVIHDELAKIPPELLEIEDRNDIESKPYSEDLSIYPVNAQILFLMLTDFYGDLVSSTREDKDASFATIDDFTPVGMLALVLKGKIETYKRYAEEIKNKESPYYRYYKFIAEHMVVNDDYTFIPKTMIKPYSVYYKKLVAEGHMIETPFGLYKTGATKVIPIVHFSNEPVRSISQRKTFVIKQL